MKKIVVFGGGTGLSCVLSGLKLFPLDVTTVIAVSDNGSSTGVLKIFPRSATSAKCFFRWQTLMRIL